MHTSLFLCTRSTKGNTTFKVVRFFLWLVFLTLLLSGCGGKKVLAPSTISPQAERMGYTIQIGAFKELDNAQKLTRSLEQKKCDAFYFRHSSGLYKVRFGNFRTGKGAYKKAEDLKRSGIIADYYIVPPSAYRIAQNRGTSSLRNDIVKTARSYKGVPYRWGGTSAKTGFDCSGLVMAVYRLNGLNLPRTSRQQFKTGKPIARHQLKKGDLIFFATGNTRKVTHVGIYTGRGRFIHAPGKGKKIRTDKLTSEYYLSNYVGARTYL